VQLKPSISHLKMKNMESGLMNKSVVKVSKRKIVEFCKQNHIQRLSLFGSILRNDFARTSDIDILVEFEPNNVPGFFNLIKMEKELSSLFNGRKVDLRTYSDLSRYFRDDVLAEAETVYIES
jgi:predicted nucleotidyltransferase